METISDSGYEDIHLIGYTMITGIHTHILDCIARVSIVFKRLFFGNRRGEKKSISGIKIISGI